MRDFAKFLTDHPSEFLIARVKSEGDLTPEQKVQFTEMFDYFALNDVYKKYWYLDSVGVPNVNEVRGKIIMLNNFNEGYRG